MKSVWLELLNSDWHDYRGSGRSEDRLEDSKWIQRFLSRWDLDLRKTPIRKIRQALKDLRALMQCIVNSVVSGRPVRKKDWTTFNTYLVDAPVVWCFEGKDNEYQLKLIPAVARNLESVLAEIAISFAEVFVYGDPNRIKICENADCRWVFYDKSRNRSRRWCESSGCGNLMKVRRFRARQKKESGAKPF